MRASDQAKSSFILRTLNPVQKQAVEYTDGPSLILAGAGSGKTRVLTHKVAYLIDRKKVSPAQILALTFTNKAAREMKHRIMELIKQQAEILWCSTFHSFFARLLRRDCIKLGFSPNFAIYDENDQLAIIKSIMEDKIQGGERFTANAIRSRISQLKNKLILPEEFNHQAEDAFDEQVAIIYPLYQSRLQQNNAMDFDDLLIKPLDLFHAFPNVLEYYQNRWQYILVDEYQDTNYPQYLLLKMLAAKHRNLSVVGDDDQSIYRWRGADIKNILNFEADFPDCKVFKLEQNYRSTGQILEVANSIILNNNHRMEKALWTKKDIGEPVTLLVSSTGDEEAFKIVHKIQNEVTHWKRNFSDFAILYRTNAQSRVLEDGLRRSGIAYIIVGGVRFYERKEVKDVLAYLRVLCNPLDEVSLRRIINYPLRGIGDTTIKRIDSFCAANKLPFIDGLKRVVEIEEIATKTKDKIIGFYNFISKYITVKDTLSAAEVATSLVDDLGILAAFKDEGTEEALNRRANVQELLTQISQFSEQHSDPSLSHFLEEISLVTDIDNWDDTANAVTLMTLHSAKGLEFPVVFIAGLEEGLLPLARNTVDTEVLEEERRLFYVGATRAQEKLYFSHALKRVRYGEFFSGNRSRFLNEINNNLLEIDDMQIYPDESIYDTEDDFLVPERKITLPPKKEKTLKPGTYVKHDRFGKGVILRLEGEDENLKATIIFEELGEKKIVLKYAKLEIL